MLERRTPKRLSWANALRLADDIALELLSYEMDVTQAMRDGKRATYWLKGAKNAR